MAFVNRLIADKVRETLISDISQESKYGSFEEWSAPTWIIIKHFKMSEQKVMCRVVSTVIWHTFSNAMTHDIV